MDRINSVIFSPGVKLDRRGAKAERAAAPDIVPEAIRRENPYVYAKIDCVPIIVSLIRRVQLDVRPEINIIIVLFIIALILIKQRCYRM